MLANWQLRNDLLRLLAILEPPSLLLSVPSGRAHTNVCVLAGRGRTNLCVSPGRGRTNLCVPAGRARTNQGRDPRFGNLLAHLELRNDLLRLVAVLEPPARQPPGRAGGVSVLPQALPFRVRAEGYGLWVGFVGCDRALHLLPGSQPGAPGMRRYCRVWGSGFGLGLRPGD
ncbi:hypothetical protein T484DRAFT_2812436 [Baffinella frigidus]|nr:hypothetical protein T484DRAFT_2812436 [Cryptophyta sp. CCMP2293]